MVAVSEYAVGVIEDVLESHAKLLSLQDKPGDLDTIRREWHRSVGLARALADRIGGSKSHQKTLEDVARGCKSLAEYDFAREIDLLYGLYEDDPNRLKNIRMKILEAFEDSRVVKLMGEAAELVGDAA